MSRPSPYLATKNRYLLLAVVAASVVVALLLAVVVTRRDSASSSDAGDPSVLTAARSATTVDAASFLHRYLASDGRVVRRDQGGDTVSEGQAYGMLIAVGAGSPRTFARIWGWTRSHLGRDDGLVSWRWDGDSVADPSSAADADLDMARALVLAGHRFGTRSYTAAGVRLGTAILDHETVGTPKGRVLVAGQWATTAPYAFNPSYVSPAATSVLAEASGDARWSELESGSRAAVRALTSEGRLPPDWAVVNADGSVQPADSPGGQPVQFGYDAARTVVRYAESCRPADRRTAVSMARSMTHTTGRDVVAVYDLGGSPQTTDKSPLATMAQASGLAAGGSKDAAVQEIRLAGREQQAVPTYYGDAWTVLAPMLLTQRGMGGCPPLGGAR